MLNNTSLLLVGLLISTSTMGQQAPVRVAVASSLMPAMIEIEKAFEKIHQLDVELIPGASGTLANQIMHGAPFDLFISADSKYSQLLYERGVCQYKPRDWVKGKLVVWSDSPMDNMNDTTSVLSLKRTLLSDQTRTVALAQPNLAPYGDATKTYLERINVYSQINQKLIYGNNVSITNQYIYTATANVVFTSLASKIALFDQVEGYWYQLDTKAQLTHSLCVIDGSNNTKKFYEFLINQSNYALLSSYGYIQL